MNLLKTSFWSGIATIIRIFVGIVLNKVIALFVGPSGVALLGQFSNYAVMLTQFGSLGINIGVTKYIAEYGGDYPRQQKVVNTSLGIVFYSSLFFGSLNFVFADEISFILFNTFEYSMIFCVFAVSLIFSSLNSTYLAILNGYKKNGYFISLGIINNLLGLIVTYVFAIKYQILGALLSVVITQSLACIATVIVAKKFSWFNFVFIKMAYDKSVVKALAKFSLMSLSSACVMPVSQIVVRKYIATQLSLDEAGYWQAVVSISGVYLMLITTSLSTYYLPRFSEINNNLELRKEICQGYKILLPVTLVLACSIYLTRDYIILLLFTPKFNPMRELFLFQLIGDVLRISSWLLGYLMFARAMTKLFLVCEIAFSGSFVGFAHFFVSSFGLIGITYAYALNFFIYLLVVYICVWRRILR